MLYLRKILFYVFTAFYLICCPLIILYGLGYLFNPIGKKAMVKTGLVYLSANPQGAAVYMGNRRYTKNTPAVIRGLLPGEYDIRLKLKGYRGWAETVIVRPAQASVYDKILLLPEEISPKKLAGNSFKDLMPLAQGRFLLLLKGEVLGDYSLYNCDEEKVYPLLVKGSPKFDYRVLNYFILNANPGIIFIVDSPQGIKYLGVEFKRGRVSLKEIAKKDSPARCLENIRGYGSWGRFVYIVDKDNELLKMDYEKEDKSVLLDGQILNSYLSEDKDSLSVRAYSKDRVFMLTKNGRLLSSLFPFQLAEKEVRGFEFYPQGETLLVWQKDRIGWISFSGIPEDNFKFARSPGINPAFAISGETYKSQGGISWVFSLGREIEQAFLIYDGSHILFRDGNKAFLLELKAPRSALSAEPVLELKAGSSLYYQEHSGKVYYLNSSGGLCWFELVPRKEIARLPFYDAQEENAEIQFYPK